MGMAQGNGQGIGGIRLWFSGQPQKRLHHVLHLGFIRSTSTHHRLFHLPGRILMDRQAAVGGTDDCSSPCLTELQGRVRIPRHKHLLNSELLRAIFANQHRETMENGLQPLRHWLFTYADAATVEVLKKPAFRTNKTVTGDSGAGVYPQDDCHPPALGSERVWPCRRWRTTSGIMPLLFICCLVAFNGFCRTAQTNMQLLQLLLVHLARRLSHQTGGALGFRESDDVAD